MSKLLAENLLRFGAKGVSEDMLKSYLLEQTRVPKNVYKTYAVTSSLAQLPNVINSYNPTSGAIKITDGNPWLATQRAKSLQQFLINRFQQEFKIPFDTTKATISKTEVPGPGDDNQYLKATIKGLLYLPPQIQTPRAYSILYNFYDINGVPHILVTKEGLGAPKIHDSTKGDDPWIREFDKFLPKIKDGKIVKQYVGGGGAAGPNKQETAYGIMIPIKSGYAAKTKGKLEFDDKDTYTAMKNFIASYTDLSDAQGKPKETGIQADPNVTGDVKTQERLQTNFTSERGGGGNYIFGDLGAGRSGIILKSNDAEDAAGKEVTIKRMEPSKIGFMSNDTVKPGEDSWKDIYPIFYRGLFPDNLITIKPEMYQKIFDEIRAIIVELRERGYEIKQMSADIQGFASTDNANNRCPQGSQPDHTWGGPVTTNLWITL